MCERGGCCFGGGGFDVGTGMVARFGVGGWCGWRRATMIGKAVLLMPTAAVPWVFATAAASIWIHSLTSCPSSSLFYCFHFLFQRRGSWGAGGNGDGGNRGNNVGACLGRDCVEGFIHRSLCEGILSKLWFIVAWAMVQG